MSETTTKQVEAVTELDDMRAAARWFFAAPELEAATKAAILGALGAAPGGEMKEDALQAWGEFIEETLHDVALIANVLRGDISVGLNDGEVAFQITAQGSARVEQMGAASPKGGAS